MSLLHPARSVCLACGALIPWYDNIPIAAYLRLRGRCRRCHAPIGRRTLIMEIATPLIGVGIHALWGLSIASLAGWLAASWTLVAIPIRLERRRWTPVFQLLGVALWTIFFWAATLHGLASM